MSARRNPNLLSFRELHTNALLSSKAAKNPAAAKESQTVFRDCADVFKAGRTTSGVYTLTFPNSTEEVKVRGCACVAGPAGLQGTLAARGARGGACSLITHSWAWVCMPPAVSHEV